MHVAKILRSGTRVTIELPDGFDLAAEPVQVSREGAGLLLTPVNVGVGSRHEWACLDHLTPAARSFSDAMERIEADDVAAGATLGTPPRFE